MSVLGLALTLFFCTGVLTARRENAALFLLGGMLYITQGQSFELAGLNLTAMRLVEISAFIRVLSRGELAQVGMTPACRALLTFLIAYWIVFCIRTGKPAMYALGLGVDGALVYFTARSWLRTGDEVVLFLKKSALLFVPFAAFMLFESLAGRNLFAILGRVPERPPTREGLFRCQGSFRHAITAGSVGATFAPLFTILLFRESTRRHGFIGIAAAACIVVTCQSSGALLGALTALCGWGCWRLRDRMYLVRYALVGGAIALHFAMSRPIWFIFDRVSSLVGGGGWHRSNLIDQFVLHWRQWVLVGMDAEGTGSWAATQMPWGGVDVTNYYVAIGIGGGLVSLLLFLNLIKRLYRLIGEGLQSARESTGALQDAMPVLWGAAVALTTHLVNILSVVYWDQSYVAWYAHLAIVVSLASWMRENGNGDEEGDSVEDPSEQEEDQAAELSGRPAPVAGVPWSPFVGPHR